MSYIEAWTVDGYVLTDGVTRGWSDRSGTGKAGGLVGTNSQVPYRRGETWTRKNLGPGSFTFNLWLTGSDAGAAYDQYNEILRHVVRPERLVRWQRTAVDGSRPSRYCMAEVIGAIEPTYVGQVGYKMGLEVSVPDGKWRSTEIYSTTSDAGSQLPRRLAVHKILATSTAPLDDLTYTVTGSLDNGWTLADVYGPDSLDCAQLIPGNGAAAVINADTWDIIGTGGFVPQLSSFAPRGPRLMTLAHGNSNFTPTVELRGSGGNTRTQLTVSGRAGWLV